MLKPHAFKTEVRGCPHICFSKQAYEDVWHLVDIVPTEVGWLGTVTQLAPDRFRIDDIVVPGQDVHSTTTELTPDGIYAAMLKLDAMDAAEPNPIPLTDPRARRNRMKYWGHSHVNMGTAASAQDESQMNFFRADGHVPWFIRGIHNKRGDSSFSFFHFQSGIVVDDCAWSVDYSTDTERRKMWQGEVAAHVKEMRFQGSYQTGYTPRTDHLLTPPGGYGFRDPYRGDHEWRPNIDGAWAGQESRR